MFSPLRALCGVVLLALAACSDLPDRQNAVDRLVNGERVTSVQLGITGAPNMNGGAPAQVKVYYLNDATTFRAADFFAVFDDPEGTLGTDLVSVSEFQLAPGRSVTDAQTFADPPAAIGIVAAFRDINGTFLAVKPLIPNVPNPAQATLSGNSVTLR